MRVLLDANLYFSYLWSPEKASGTIAKIIGAALASVFELVIPAELIEEMESALQDKPYFRDRITLDQLRDLVEALGGISDERPYLPEPWLDVVRDPKDNFLLAAAVHADVDVLVSGDKDLLVLASHLERPTILSPREFLESIEA